jgi:hypothetical protein
MDVISRVYMEVFFSVVGLDENNGLFLIVYAIIECENNEKQCWIVYALYGSIKH